MFFLLLFSFYTNGQSIAFSGDPGARAGSMDEVFRQLVTTYFDGVATKDFRKMVATTTPDFVVYEFGKKWNNDSGFRNIQFHEPFSVKYTMTDFVAFADTRSGDATYRTQADFVFGEAKETARQDFYETATFRKTATGWKINMITVSAVEPPVVDVKPGYVKYDTVRFIPEHYRERRALFAREVPTKGRVVFLGNSITEYGDWKALLHDSGAVNRGIAGDNTFGMLERLAEVIELRPSTLFIEAGVNDIGQAVPPAQIAANIGTMVSYMRVKSPSTRVYVISLLPTNAHAQANYPEIAGKNATIREVDRLLREQAAARGYTYIDVAARIADSAGELDERYGRKDGVHLNEEGYKVFMSCVNGLLKNY